MATISAAGIGSGLDVAGIVSSLMTVERQPLVALQTQATSINSEISTFGTLQSYTSAMRDKAAALSSVTMWNRTTVTSSNTGAVGAATTGGAVAGSYSIGVSQLATSQSVTSHVFSATTDLVGGGTLTIEYGGWIGGEPPTGFEPKADATPLTITVAPEDTLATVRDKINASGGDVTATIITDAAGSRLSIRSKETGEENGFRISAIEDFSDGDAATGLSALTYDAMSPDSQMTRNEAAKNALATINGIDIVSASNSLTGVADGLNLTLSAVTTSNVQIDVKPDTEAVKTAINDFVTAFNTLATYIRDQTKYDETTKQGGALQGDGAVLGLQSQLRGVVNQESTASGQWSTLSDIGISMQADGTLKVDSTKLDGALSDLPELRKLLATDGSDPASSGFMDRFRDVGDAALGFEGTFESRNASLKAQLELNSDRQAQLEVRLDQTEERLNAQYSALDTNMAKLSQLSNFVTQQLSVLSFSSGS